MSNRWHCTSGSSEPGTSAVSVRVKVSLAITEKQGLIVGARSFAENPYDGHTLAGQLEQTNILLQDLPGAPKPKTVLADPGFHGVDADVVPVRLIHRSKHKTLSTTQRMWLKRRQAIEPIVGHVKQDHGMQRCWLKGQTGDALHAVLCAAGYNLRWLLRAIVRLGLRPYFLFSRGCAACPTSCHKPFCRPAQPAEDRKVRQHPIDPSVASDSEIEFCRPDYVSREELIDPDFELVMRWIGRRDW
jgi:Transposase DDE domain